MRSDSQYAPIIGAVNPANTAINSVSGPWPSSVPKTSIDTQQAGGMQNSATHAINDLTPPTLRPDGDT